MPFGGITKRLITVVMIESVLSALLLGLSMISIAL